jgi:hypothetical protein
MQVFDLDISRVLSIVEAQYRQELWAAQQEKPGQGVQPNNPHHVGASEELHTAHMRRGAVPITTDLSLPSKAGHHQWRPPAILVTAGMVSTQRSCGLSLCGLHPAAVLPLQCEQAHLRYPILAKDDLVGGYATLGLMVQS